MKLLKRDEVCDLTRMSRATLYIEVGAGRFPKPIKVTRRSVAWIENEVLEYLQGRPRAAGNDIKI